MQFFDSIAAVPGGFGPSAVTIGKFDGVHAGHRTVIGQLRSLARDAGLTATILTFDRNPLSLLNPERCPESLVSNEQKVRLLESTGVDATLMVAFDRQFSEQPPEAFVRDILVGTLNARVLFVGSDFRFGARGAGTVETLQTLGAELGFEVRLTPDVSAQDGRRVSSTLIRELLSAGKIAEASEALGSPHTIRSTVVHGAHRGRELGYPTANLAPEVEGFIPADGVYAAWFTVDGVRHPAAVSIGNNPTFAGVPDKQVEAHVLDATLDLYGKVVDVSFVEYIRPMHAFDGVETLVVQLRRDEQQIRGIFDALPERAAN